MIQEFNDTHPNIQVNREVLENDQLRTIIQTRLGSGDVDVFGYDTGPGFGGVLAKAGLVADMGAAYDRYGWGTFDWAKSRCTYTGVLSCMPGRSSSSASSTTRRCSPTRDSASPDPRGIPDDHGRLQGRRRRAARLRRPAAVAGRPPVEDDPVELVGRAGMDARLYGDDRWNDAPSVKAIDIFFKKFQEAGYFPRDPNAVTYEDANALFDGGKAAMIPTNVARRRDHGQHERQFDVGFFPFPSIEGTKISPPSGLGGVPSWPPTRRIRRSRWCSSTG